jgi:membrane-associated protein
MSIFLDPVALIATFGYIGLFIIIFAESGALIGFFLPGDSLLFSAGFLASQGILDIRILLPLLFLAAFAGDSFGYFIGRQIGPRIFTRPKSFWFHPDHVEKTRKFFEEHGSKTIVLARFIPIIRTFAPIMAGVGGMHYKNFVSYNFMGAVIWAIGVTMLGYLFGNVVPNADKYMLYIILIIINVSFLPPAWHYYKERKKRENKPLS